MNRFSVAFMIPWNRLPLLCWISK